MGYKIEVPELFQFSHQHKLKKVGYKSLDMYISEDRLEVVVLTRCFTPFEALQRTDIMEEKSSFYMVAIS